MTEGVLELRGIHKAFGGFELGPLSVGLRPGRACGLLGPNGAGKTTLLNLLAVQLRPTGGEIRHGGQRIDWGDVSWKARFSYIRETPVFHDELSVADTLRLGGRLCARWDAPFAARLMDRFGLEGRSVVGTLSKGSRVKLGLVLALAHRAQWLLLDEPSAGLDPSARADLQRTLRELMQEQPGLGVLLSSHIFEDLDQVADDLLVLRHGQIVFESTFDAVRQLTVFRVPESLRLAPSPDVHLAWRNARWCYVMVPRASRLAQELRHTSYCVEDRGDVLAAIYHGTEHL